ncbi:MAG: hypothetical protein JWM04_2429, partial [Verrucomicrobiales bacterium]|nr:hypothetical protein [Verrucomicrobiales bacterium]
SMGTHFIVYPTLKKLFPFLGVARFPVKFLVVVAFLLPLAAATGVRFLFTGQKSFKSWLVIVSTLIATGVLVLVAIPAAGINVSTNQVIENGAVRIVILGLATWQVWKSLTAAKAKSKTILTAIAFVCVPLDFVTHAHWQNPTLPPDVLKTGFWQPTTLPKPQVGIDRVFILPSVDDALNFSPIPNTLTNFLGKRLAEWSSLNMIDAIPKVNGSATLQVREQAIVQRTLYSNNVPPNALLDFLAVTHISDPETKIRFNPRTPPRLWAAGGAEVKTAKPDEILTSIFSATFDPTETTYLENLDALVAPITKSKLQTTVVKIEANKIQIKTHGDAPALLTIAESYYPAWKVEVDDKKETVLRANYAFMGVAVPKGDHTVTFKYQDKTMLTGAAISAISLVLLAALALLEKTRFKKSL